MECVRQKAEITYENTLEGVLLRRVNRFTAEAEIDGKPATVHIRNTGRLENLLLPLARITVQRSDNPERKTPYDLISVYRPGFKWVNVDSLAPNMLMKPQRNRRRHDGRRLLIIHAMKLFCGSSRIIKVSTKTAK